MNPMQELVAKCNALLAALGGGRDVYMGSRHRFYDATFLPEKDPVIALHAAIPAALAYAERVGEVVEALRELTRLKRIKERMEAIKANDFAGMNEVPEYDLLSAEYESKKEPAWDTAKALLASIDSAEVGESAGGWRR